LIRICKLNTLVKKALDLLLTFFSRTNGFFQFQEHNQQ
jgi:hypothetical protein